MTASLICLIAACGDAAAVHGCGAARIGREAVSGVPPPDRAREGRGARAIGREALGAVDGPVDENLAGAGRDGRGPAQGHGGRGRTRGERTIGGGVGPVQADRILLIALRPGGGDAAHRDRTRLIGRHAGEGGAAADWAGHGRGARSVHGQVLRAIDRAAQRECPRPRAGERGIGSQRHRIIIGLRPRRHDRPAVEGCGAARIGREAGERRAAPDRAREGRGARAIGREIGPAIDGAVEDDRARTGGDREIAAQGHGLRQSHRIVGRGDRAGAGRRDRACPVLRDRAIGIEIGIERQRAGIGEREGAGVGGRDRLSDRESPAGNVA